MVATKRYFFAFLLFIVQLSLCNSKNVLEDNRQEIQTICDKHQNETFADFVENVKKDVQRKLSTKVEVISLDISEKQFPLTEWDYNIGKKEGNETNGLAVRTGGKFVGLFLSEYGCKNESIFRHSITGDNRFSGPCQQLLQAMSSPNYVQGVCALYYLTPTAALESDSNFSFASYCYKENAGVFTFTKKTTKPCFEEVKVFVRQLDNCKKSI